MALSLNGRALHFVFKVADRAATARFYRDLLGMKVNFNMCNFFFFAKYWEVSNYTNYAKLKFLLSNVNR